MTTNTSAKTSLRVVERAFDAMDDVAEPTTLGLVTSGVVVAAILLMASVFGW